MGRRRRRRRVDPADAARALPEAIAALSQTLPAGPSPETFRRAKFDRPEAAPALWRLLFRVLSPQLADGASASFSPEAQVRSVKLALRTQGYPRRALAQLPDDGSQGGRELLLALAWLLARGPLPERLLTQNRVQLGDEMPVCECEALASPGPPAPSVEADGCVDIRHLQWLMGKLRFRWRNLMASQQEQCALLGKPGVCTACFRSTHIPVAATATAALATCLSPKRSCSETRRVAVSCCGGWRGRTRGCRRPSSGGAGSWSSGGGWTRSWAPAPLRPHSPRFCPGSPHQGLERWSPWCGSCRPCRESCERRWRPGGRPGRPGSEAVGPSGAPRGRPCGRPWDRTWPLCGRPASEAAAAAWPSPTGPTGW
ncbi:tubulin epsilon and delta complex protein 1 isoform X4 [Tursiops truncatus]|uniref:tubulin epsilon and delta complex protein 1 isoform X4 n=1 Tax=Tursiops truncatus TaxID=9739 RepID=UPI003CCF8B28